MIEPIEGLPDGVVGIEAKGEVTGEDYERVLIPAVERELESGGKISLLYILGAEFDGYSAAAIWDDARVGMTHLFSWERIAMVTDHSGYGHLVKGLGFMIPAPVRVFGLDDLDEARSWVAGD